MLGGVQSADQLGHEGVCILCHERVVQFLAEGDEGAHGHGGDAVDGVVELLQELGHDGGMPGVLEMRCLIVGELSEGVDGLASHSRVLMLHVLKQELGHFVDVLVLLDVFDGLLDSGQSSQLGLPVVLRGKVAHQGEQRRAQGVHADGLDDSVDRLLTVVVEFVHILFSLLVVHALGPLLEGGIAIFDLQHQVHAALQGEAGEVWKALRQPLWLALAVLREPLHGHGADVAVALLRLHQSGHQLRGLHGALELLLEEVWLDGDDLDVV
mmetsp:Transcript_77073/g.160417  ORF Transcript_77073/g.160417 Transcript_77073/m.160417 type:complete len:268 (-) Transcript_77073:923-1726(-)